VSMLDHTLKPEPVRRLEVITGTGRRRRFSDDDKARIVEETLAPGVACTRFGRHPLKRIPPAFRTPRDLDIRSSSAGVSDYRSIQCSRTHQPWHGRAFDTFCGLCARSSARRRSSLSLATNFNRAILAR
jgi:hypothetical protein